jgi:hypothetical protein
VTALLGVIPTSVVDLGAAPLVVFFAGLVSSVVAATYVAYTTFSAEKRRGKRPRRKR